MIQVEVRTEGLQELLTTLRALPQAVGAKVVDRAMKKAAAPLVAEARRLAPRSDSPRVDRKRLKYLKRFVHMADSISAKSAGITPAGEVAIWIGPAKNAYWGMFQEFGHAIVVRQGTEEVERKYSHWRGSDRAGDRELVSTSRRKSRKRLVIVGHQPPRPFLRPAVDSLGARVIEDLKASVWREIERTVNRLARKADRGNLSASEARAFRE